MHFFFIFSHTFLFDFFFVFTAQISQTTVTSQIVAFARGLARWRGIGQMGRMRERLLDRTIWLIQDDIQVNLIVDHKLNVSLFCASNFSVIGICWDSLHLITYQVFFEKRCDTLGWQYVNLNGEFQNSVTISMRIHVSHADFVTSKKKRSKKKKKTLRSHIRSDFFLRFSTVKFIGNKAFLFENLRIYSIHLDRAQKWTENKKI